MAKRQGLEGRIDIAPLLGRVAVERFAQLRYGFYLGGNRGVDGTGVTLGMFGGAGAEPATCVSPPGPRDRATVAPPAFPTTAPDGNPYHVAIALSREAVEDLFSAVWRSGAFCLLPTSYTVAQLTSDVFSIRRAGPVGGQKESN